MQETRGSRVINYFYDANGQAIALRYRSGPNAEWTYYYYDYNSRGDIVGLYAENGNPECAYTYDPWGKLLSVKNPAGTEMTSATYIGNLQSLKYRGYVYDRETGLYYLQSRYYDPVTRRFVNADGLLPIGTGVLGYNMFAYCGNNPIVYSDCTGYFTDYSIPTYSGITVTGYFFSNVPEHWLGYYGQIKTYWRVDNLSIEQESTCALYYSSNIIYNSETNTAKITIPLEAINYIDFVNKGEINQESQMLGLCLLLVIDVNSISNKRLKVSPENIFRLCGEMILHVNGYLNPLFDDMYNSCKVIELDISAKSVLDPRGGIKGLIINDLAWLIGNKVSNDYYR